MNLSHPRPRTVALRALIIVALAAALAGGAAFAAPPAHAAAGDLLGYATYYGADIAGYDSGVACGTDGAGDQYVAAYAATTLDAYEAYVIKFGFWGTNWNLLGDTRLNDMAVADGGQNFSCGFTGSTGHGTDYLMLSFNGDGSLAGYRTYDGPGHGNDEARAVALGADGSCYVTGMSKAADGDMDIATVKYGPAGERQWVRRYNSPWDKFDAGSAVCVHGSSLYVAGTSVHPGHGEDVVLIRYTAAGGLKKWVRSYDGSKHVYESVSAVVASGSSVFVAGSVNNGMVLGGDAMLLRYTPSGAFGWLRKDAGSAGGYDGWSDAALSTDGSVVATGSVWHNSTGDDVMTADYTASGLRAWKATTTSTGQQLDEGSALTIDPFGAVYVAGSFYRGSTNGQDGFVICYGPDGSEVWRTYTAASGDDGFRDVTASSTTVLTTGSSYTGPAHLDDIMIATFAKT